MQHSQFAWIVLITAAALAGLTFAGPAADGLSVAHAAPASAGVAAVWQPLHEQLEVIAVDGAHLVSLLLMLILLVNPQPTLRHACDRCALHA